jgi:hypothetical protein
LDDKSDEGTAQSKGRIRSAEIVRELDETHLRKRSPIGNMIFVSGKRSCIFQEYDRGNVHAAAIVQLFAGVTKAINICAISKSQVFSRRAGSASWKYPCLV